MTSPLKVFPSKLAWLRQFMGARVRVLRVQRSKGRVLEVGRFARVVNVADDETLTIEGIRVPKGRSVLDVGGADLGDRVILKGVRPCDVEIVKP